MHRVPDHKRIQSLQTFRSIELESLEFERSLGGRKAVVGDLGENSTLRVVSVSGDIKTIIGKMRVAASMWSPDSSRVLVREASFGKNGAHPSMWCSTRQRVMPHGCV